MENNLLSQLRDIHYPNTISIFPLAIGWYILIFIFILFFILLIIKLLHLKIKHYKINKVYQIIDLIESNDSYSEDFLAHLTVLLKRVAKLKYAKEKPQLLYGVDFLKFLDSKINSDDFTNGAGRNLLNIYQKQTNFDNSDLIALVKKWIRTAL